MDARLNEIVTPSNNTCTWLLHNTKFVDWLNQGGVLWIKGKPGSGKSTLMDFALRHIKEHFSSTAIIAAFFIHGRGSPLQRNSLGLFRSLLHQILSQNYESLAELRLIFEAKKATQGEVGKAWNWSVKELGDFMTTCLSRSCLARPVCILVDALDECGEDTAIELIDYFQRLSARQPRPEILKICFSCRHYPILYLGSGLQICVELENAADISTYVHTSLESCASIRNHFEKDIVSKASGIFQWASLISRQVVKLHRDGKPLQVIQNRLKDLPEDLNGVYRQILDRIDREDRASTLLLMQWVCLAIDPYRQLNSSLL
jgi:hypothetical protein